MTTSRAAVNACVGAISSEVGDAHKQTRTHPFSSESQFFLFLENVGKAPTGLMTHITRKCDMHITNPAASEAARSSLAGARALLYVEVKRRQVESAFGAALAALGLVNKTNSYAKTLLVAAPLRTSCLIDIYSAGRQKLQWSKMGSARCANSFLGGSFTWNRSSRQCLRRSGATF